MLGVAPGFGGMVAVPVALLDTDPQGSAVTWAKHGEAMGVGPGLLAEIAHKINASDPRRLRAAVDAAVKAGARRVIIDGPPSFARPALAAALVADVVLIPAGPSALDLIPAGATLDIVKEAKAQRRGRGRGGRCGIGKNGLCHRRLVCGSN